MVEHVNFEMFIRQPHRIVKKGTLRGDTQASDFRK